MADQEKVLAAVHALDTAITGLAVYGLSLRDYQTMKLRAMQENRPIDSSDLETVLRLSQDAIDNI